MEGDARKGRNPFRRRHRQVSEEHPRDQASVAQQFLSELHGLLVRGHITHNTEAHLRNVFRSLGHDTMLDKLAAEVDREIERLESEAFVLKAVRQRLFGSQ